MLKEELNLSPTNEETWERRAEKAGNTLTRHPWRWGLGTLAILIIGGWVLGFAGSWLDAGTKPFRPANVETQFKAVIEGWNAMGAAAENSCKFEESENSQTFSESPALAYEATYRKVQVDYNRRQSNFFEAGEVGPDPSKYPDVAPSLAERQSEIYGLPVQELWRVCPSYPPPKGVVP